MNLLNRPWRLGALWLCLTAFGTAQAGVQVTQWVDSGPFSVDAAAPSTTFTEPGAMASRAEGSLPASVAKNGRTPHSSFFVPSSAPEASTWLPMVAGMVLIGWCLRSTGRPPR